MAELCSSLKIAWHDEKLRSYLAGEAILPATVELDITTECDAGCHGCPSTGAQERRRFEMPILDRFFGELEGSTRGLLVSGGEPTQSPDFPAALALARARGFLDVTVVTNGSRLGQPRVQDALLRHGSAVRVSIYGWTPTGPDERLAGVLSSVSALRRRVDEEGSGLEIGMSLLTSAGMADQLPHAAAVVRDAGAHWLYLHPRCTGWSTGQLGLEEQEGVARRARELAGGAGTDGFRVHYGGERYGAAPLTFGAYHTSHFLLVVGADKRIYVGTESKYQPRYVVGEIDEGWTADRLRDAGRLQAIAEASSAAYGGAGGRHRGILYASLVERLIEDTGQVDAVCARAREAELAFPHVL